MRRRSLVCGRSDNTGVGRYSAVDPWSGKPQLEVVLSGDAVVEQALETAHQARASTAALPPYRRAEILDALAEAVAAHGDEFVRAMVAEVGKPVTFARGELARCVTTLRFAAGEARRPAGELVALDAVPAGEGRTGLVQRFPVGLVVGISPFNFPLNLVAHKVAPAMAAGCPWIIKPPLQAPTCALLLAKLAISAGWPASAGHVLLVDDQRAQNLVQDPRPAALSFTGSDTVGWKLKALAGKKRVMLELGGAAPVIIHRDADLDLAAARISFGGFAFAGQVCISVQRVLAHRDIYEDLCGRLATATDALSFGDPNREDTVSGPLIDQGAADRVQAWLDDAVQAGGRVVAGGGRQGPRLLRPVLLDQVPPDQALVQRELFGPGIVLAPYDTVDQAAALANAGRFGLQAGVFTRDIQVLMALYRKLEVGGLIHDDVPTFRVDQMPYGGVKDSGLGREGVRYAIAEYTEPRLLALRA
ncbi:MAG: aldehyde dehydrogenase family protein [Oligoflexia bacterium]|nr:aldehyde dehydrogenase family protein [Oligoflexia bacterium]